MDINDIAKAAGVSRATVSRFLNDGYVSAEKRAAIAKVIEETGYVPSSHAQTLRTGRTKLVGVVIPKINSYSVSRMVAGITSALDETGYQVLLANTDNDSSRELDYLRVFAERNQVDGVILIATELTGAHYRALKELSVPVVVLGQQAEGVSCVYNDDYHAMRELCTKVLAHAKAPAYIGAPDSDQAAGAMRRQGFMDACAERGIALGQESMAVGDFSIASGFACAKHILQAAPETDTLVCATDDMALGALSYLHEQGRRVPKDVQVCGVGDSSLASISNPVLTTVHLFFRTSGEEAARMLVLDIEKGSRAPRSLMMGYELKLRASTR